MLQTRKQVPSVESNWLWHDMSEHEYDRYFTKVVYLPNDAPDWAECTNEEKEQWEREHPRPEPEQ